MARQVQQRPAWIVARQRGTRRRAMRPPPDAGPDTTCSSSTLCGGPASPTHRALMAHDLYLDYDSSFGRNFPQHVFVDAQGIAIFGGTRFLRASADGQLLFAAPERPPGSIASIAQGPNNFGVVCLVDGIADYRFRIVSADGMPDLATCARLGGHVAWDGTAYRLFGGTGSADHMFVKTRTHPTAARRPSWSTTASSPTTLRGPCSGRVWSSPRSFASASGGYGARMRRPVGGAAAPLVAPHGPEYLLPASR
jgi:hypothetical protein